MLESFISTQLRKQGPKVLHQFIIGHADELAQLLLAAVLTSAERSPQPRKREAERYRQAEERDARILGFLRSQGREGASLTDLVTTTGLSKKQLRQRLWRLREAGSLKTAGSTSKALYFVT
jgi:hypothetical protein